MPQALPLSSQISQSSTAETSYSLLEASYGNGYSQRAATGINNISATWTVNWENLTASNFTALVTAFDTAFGVDYFTWQAPGDATIKKWIVKSYSRTASAGSIYSVSAKLEQVFDL